MNENQQPSNNGNGRIMLAAATSTTSSTTRKGMKSKKLSSSSRKKRKSKIDFNKFIEDGKRKRTDDDQRGGQPLSSFDHNNSSGLSNSASPRNASLEENKNKNVEDVSNFFASLGNNIQQQNETTTTTTTSSSEYSSDGLTQQMAEYAEYWEESNSSEGKLLPSSSTSTQESAGASLPPCMTEKKQQHQRPNVSDNSMIQHRSHNETQQLTRAGSIDSTKSRSAAHKPLTDDQKAMIEAKRLEAKRKRMSRQSPSCNALSAVQQQQSSSSAGMKLSANRSSSAGMFPLQKQNQMKRTQPNNAVAQKPMQQQTRMGMEPGCSERSETVVSVAGVNQPHHSTASSSVAKYAQLPSGSPSAEETIASDTSSEVGKVLFYEDERLEEDNDVATNDNKKGATLTQCWSKKDDDSSRERKTENQTFPTQKFIMPRHISTGRKDVMFKSGDVWFSPRYKEFAFLVKEIILEDQLYKADVYAFMKAEKTFIKEFASNARYLEWVMVTKHPDLPENGHINLRDLHECMFMFEDKPFLMHLDNVHLALRYAEDDDTVVYEYARGAQMYSNNHHMPRMFEIFAGGGGMSCGAREVGISNCVKVDMDRMACKTLEANFPDALVLTLDVRDFNAKTWRRELELPSDPDALLQAPPCNGFSAANTSGGRNDIQNCNCTLESIETVRLLQSKFVAMENVPGLLQKKEVPGAGRMRVSYLQEYMAGLLSMDYQIRLCKRLNAMHYGDPQDRKRVISFAAKRGYALPEAPRPTHGNEPNLRKIVTVRDAIGDLEDIEPTEDGIVILNDGSEARGHYLKDTKRVEKHVEKQDTVLQPDLPACTVRKHNTLVHYNRKRNITQLERARLMSFPDNFVFKGNHGEQGDQIGNAIPVKFAAAIATAMKEAFRLGLHHEPPPAGA
jgi:DNA (cytosine-5)-methyltransferase 1